MVHASASDGFARGVDAYRRARPEYQRDISAPLIAEYGTGTVADVGAGTGILTRALAEGLPGVRVLEGSAENLPLGDHSIGTIVTA